jgi:hypothetical protein
MDDRRDWVRSVMLPTIGVMGLAGALIGGLVLGSMGPIKGPPDPLSDAICGAVVFAAPTYAVMWLVWFVRRMRE